MHFTLVDQFLELTDTSAIAVKNVTAAEEYLQDHFPGFPVRPGETLKVEVTLEKTKDDGSVVFKAQGTVLKGLAGDSAVAETAVSGRLILRALRN